MKKIKYSRSKRYALKRVKGGVRRWKRKGKGGRKRFPIGLRGSIIVYKVHGAFGTEKDFYSKKKAERYVKGDPDSRFIIKHRHWPKKKKKT